MSATKPRILLIDDDRSFLKKVSHFLGLSGFRATTISDPLKALEAWKSGVFRVAVTDINMPEMNGIDVLRALRGLDGEAPVIVLTGQDDEAVRRQAMTAGAFIFLTKPLDLERFVAVISEIPDRPVTGPNRRPDRPVPRRPKPGKGEHM